MDLCFRNSNSSYTERRRYLCSFKKIWRRCSPIKKNSKTGGPLDLGFDLSAASTKALKKAASRLGVAREVEVAEPDDEGSVPAGQRNPTSAGQRAVPPPQPKRSHDSVFPDDDVPFEIPAPVNTKAGSDESATPVQTQHIKNRVGSSGLNMLEAIRRGLGREDVPDQPEHLTKEEAKKVLIFLNR